LLFWESLVWEIVRPPADFRSFTFY